MISIIFWIFLAQTGLRAVIAFVAPIPARDISRRQPFRASTSTAPPRYSNYDDPFSVDSANTSWTQEEDWALIDGVRTFTIGEAEGRRYTFWERMVRASPDLSERSAEEARERYGSMRSEDEAMSEAGPSPPMLHDWWVRTADGNMAGMGGTLDDGRIVWFPLQCLGRFDNHILDAFGPAPPTLASAAVPGGYAEASGGKVYELGTPRATETAAAATSRNAEGGEAAEFFRQTAKASAAALAAAAILSIAVGFGAGLGVSSRAGGGPAGTEAYGNFGMSVPAAKATAAPIRIERSISEMRARQEVRVLQVKRIARELDGRLKEDEARLEELRRLERESMRNENAGGI